jgi:hypothetical protein
MNPHEIDLPHQADPRWLENRLEARGLSGLRRRISVRAMAMIHAILERMRPRKAECWCTVAWHLLCPE